MGLWNQNLQCSLLIKPKVTMLIAHKTKSCNAHCSRGWFCFIDVMNPGFPLTDISNNGVSYIQLAGISWKDISNNDKSYPAWDKTVSGVSEFETQHSISAYVFSISVLVPFNISISNSVKKQSINLTSLKIYKGFKKTECGNIDFVLLASWSATMWHILFRGDSIQQCLTDY